jgi:hypothetical protein
MLGCGVISGVILGELDGGTSRFFVVTREATKDWGIAGSERSGMWRLSNSGGNSAVRSELGGTGVALS